MGFLRRLFNGPPRDGFDAAESATDPASDDADERAYELELLKGEEARLDELAKRQLRYAKYAWQPPTQGGERRADDRDKRG